MSEPADAGAAPEQFSSLLFAAGPGAGSETDEVTDLSFARDLNLDQIVSAIAGDREDRDLITAALLRPLRDQAAVRYRHEVFRDLDDPALLEAAKEFADRMAQVRAHLRGLPAMRYRHQREGWLLDAASVYCDAVRSLSASLASARPGSRALRGLRDYLASYVSSAAFTALADDTRDTRAALGRVRYCTRIRGSRVEVSRYGGEDDYSAVVLRTFERFKQDAARDYLVPFRVRPGMNHVAAEIAVIVARLFPAEFGMLEEFCRRHAPFSDEGLGRVARELAFYLAYLDHVRPLRAAGLPFCYPVVSASSKDVSATDTFDLALARKLVAEHRPVVTNGFHLRDGERVLVVTGPNQGGKTTFARTFGQLHHLAGTGCPVPGSAARLFLADRVFTHFERADDLARQTGKLEDDLLRISEILRAATATASSSSTRPSPPPPLTTPASSARSC